MPRKIREIEALLLKKGFDWRPAKGSHTFWLHPLLPDDPITIAGKDGSDAKRYLEKDVERVLKKLEGLEEENLEE